MTQPTPTPIAQMDRTTFMALPEWKRDDLKKAVYLY